MAQVAKCLLCNHEDPTLDFQNLCEKQNTIAREVKTGGFLGLAC